MPFYRFFVRGSDPSLPDDVRGFFTTRHAHAANEAEAARKVLRQLTQEFAFGVSAKIWSAGPPLLTIEKAWRIGIHELWSAPNRGSTFHDDRDSDGAEGCEMRFRILD